MEQKEDVARKATMANIKTAAADKGTRIIYAIGTDQRPCQLLFGSRFRCKKNSPQGNAPQVRSPLTIPKSQSAFAARSSKQHV